MVSTDMARFEMCVAGIGLPAIDWLVGGTFSYSEDRR